MKIGIIGSGNVATVLGRATAKAEHEIVQVISRNEEHAENLAKELKCGYASTFDALNRNLDLYIVAISDSSLLELDKHLSLEKKLVVHTAGSVPKNILQNISKNYGVLYPLQSLRKELENVPEIPLLVDANTAENLTLIYDFAKTIFEDVKQASDEERLKLHVGAIIVNNFTNHLYSLTEEYCENENVDFKLLLPLINETASRLQSFSPYELQTGPAARKDHITTEKHLAVLENHAALKRIYEVMTESILANL